MFNPAIQNSFRAALVMTAASFFSGVLGGLIGIPALRMMGIYLAVATLAFSIIVEMLNLWEKSNRAKSLSED